MDQPSVDDDIQRYLQEYQQGYNGKTAENQTHNSFLFRRRKPEDVTHSISPFISVANQVYHGRMIMTREMVIILAVYIERQRMM